MALASAFGVTAPPTLTAVPVLPTMAAVQSSWEEARKIQERSTQQQPDLQRKTMMCKTGSTLQIWPDGTVNGTHHRNSKYGVLQLMVASILAVTNIADILKPNNVPKINIRGEASKMWLCMNSTGYLYGSVTKSAECEFHEKTLGTLWNVYYSAKYPLGKNNRRWYIALDRRTGQAKKSVSSHKKMSNFLTMPVSNDKRSEGIFTVSSVRITPPLKVKNVASRGRHSKLHRGHQHTIRHRKTSTEDLGRRRRPKKTKESSQKQISHLNKLLDSLELALSDVPSSTSLSEDWMFSSSNTKRFHTLLESINKRESIRHSERKKSQLRRKSSLKRSRQYDE